MVETGYRFDSTPYATVRFHALMFSAKSNNKSGKRISYSFAEFAEMVGKERTWVYRQVQRNRIRAITGFGAAMIPASEVERIFGIGQEKESTL